MVPRGILKGQLALWKHLPRTWMSTMVKANTCFALGLEKGMELVHSLPDVYAVFITSDGKLHFSDGYLESIPTQTK